MRPKHLVLALLGFASSCALPESAPPPDGGTDSGGTAGLPTGGSATGGSATGGTSTGGTATGGTATGGTSTGGTATGGTATGGTATGGTATGGTATGGTSTGGASGSTTGGSSTGGTGGGGTSAGGTGGRGGTSAAGAGGGGGTSAAGAGAGGLGGTGTSGGGGAGGRASGGGGSAAGGAGAGPVVELARDKSATADSEENNTTSNPPKVNLAGSANDGSATTRWCAASGGQHYWQVDLGASHSLARVEIDFEYPTQAAGASYGYVIGVSTDGTTFTTALDRTANTGTTMTQTGMLPASTTGRYVRITVIPPTTTPNPTWSSFWEARVYGQ